MNQSISFYETAFAALIAKSDSKWNSLLATSTKEELYALRTLWVLAEKLTDTQRQRLHQIRWILEDIR